MSGVLCAWAADLPASSEQWYEDEYIPEMMSRHSRRALLSDIIETPLDKDLEGVATKDAPWKTLTIYDIDDVQKMTDATYDENNHPPTDGPLRGARFDVRTYEEIKRWQSGEWNGDGADVASFLLFEWQPTPELADKIVDFYQSEIGPLLSTAPEVMRLRWFKIHNATVLKGNTYTTLKSEELHTYLSIIEMDSEEWPWDQILAMNELPQWVEYFEEQRAVKWQASHYVVKRSYPDVQGDDSSSA